MKWLIVEDALRGRKGHWLEYVSTFVRGLKDLGDEVTVLCDRKAEGFILEQTGARPVLPESIWHHMGEGAGALRRYARVPGHAWATFVAVRKVFRAQFSEKEDLTTESTEDTEASDGRCLARPSGAEFSNPFTSELARDCENTSPTRGASGHASSLPATSHSLRATVPESLTPATSYPLPATFSPPDWIFVPTVLVHHLMGWWLLLKTGSVPRKSRVLLFFPNLPIRLDNVGRAYWNAGPTTKLMAWLFSSLRKEVDGGRVLLGVETHAMRRALEVLIQMPVIYLPHPVEANTTGLQVETTNQTNLHERGRQGDAQGTCAGASEPGSLASKLADSPVSDSLIRFADGPALAPEAPRTVPGGIMQDFTGQDDESKIAEGAKLVPSSATRNALDSGHSTLDSEVSASPIVFGCYGAARWEKGSDIFLKAIRLVLQKAEKLKSLDPRPSALDSSLAATAAGRPLRFAIQWVENFRDDSGNLVSIDPWLLEHPQVEVIERYFEGDEYLQQLAGTDVMVLPYRSPYRLRVSRVVIEAMINGLPVITTRETTLFEQAEKCGVAVGCNEGSAESLAQAMLDVAERFVGLQEDAMIMAKTAAESFSVDYFRELLHNF